MEAGKSLMPEKRNLWAVLVVPWEPANMYIFGSVLLLATFVPFAAAWCYDRFLSAKAPELPDWWLTVPIATTLCIMLMLFFVRRRMDRVAAALPQGASLRSDCVLVRGMMQMPGVVQISGGRLLIQPMMGKQISIDLSRISNVTVHHWYNGSPYPGRTAFFRLAVCRASADVLRLGFGVGDAEPWRRQLPIPAV